MEEKKNGSRLAPLQSAFLALLVAVSSGGNAASSQDAFADGVAASKQGHYEAAVDHFRNAREQGLDTAALHHNLGVAYYKLGRYDAARAEFKEAAKIEGLSALSRYNLGLVEQAAGNEAEADRQFRKAYEQANTARLRSLAADKLDIEPGPATPYFLYTEAFSGYDSNPALAEEDTQDTGGESDGDAVYGALAAGRYLVSGNWSNGFALYGNVYLSRFADLDEEDLDSVTGGGAVYNSVGDWQQRYQLTANHLRLGGDTVSNSVRAGLRGRRDLGGDLELGLRARAEYISGDEASGFDYLTGWRADTRLRLNGAAGALAWELDYEFEYNDRDDISVGNFFQSVSPSRHEVGVELGYPLVGRLRGQIDTEYRLSRYSDTEVRNGEDRGEREDDRLSAGVGLSHPIGTHWTGRIEADYLDNNSNFNAFDYERTEVLLSLARTFR